MSSSSVAKEILFGSLSGLVVLLLGTIFILQFRTPPKTETTSKAASPIESVEKKVQTTKSGKPPQFIVMSFDGSKSLQMWRDSRAFAQQMKQEGKPIHFTYFISGVYFLAPQFASVYHPPGLPAGTSLLGFSDSRDDIPERIKQVNGAVSEGHEIASHVNGHFAGYPWSKAQWQQEFDEFNKLIFHWKENNQFSGEEDLHLLPGDIIGFRAPDLSKNNWMYQILHERGFKYDASTVTNDYQSWPTQNADGIWLIPLANIPLVGTNGRTISMDYNFFSAQSHVKEVAHRGNYLWDAFYKQMLQSYEDYFNANYNSTRAPVIIGHHFSLYNDSVYWQVMQDFAREECGKPEVRCVNFRELTAYLEASKSGNLK